MLLLRLTGHLFVRMVSVVGSGAGQQGVEWHVVELIRANYFSVRITRGTEEGRAVVEAASVGLLKDLFDLV